MPDTCADRSRKPLSIASESLGSGVIFSTTRTTAAAGFIYRRPRFRSHSRQDCGTVGCAFFGLDRFDWLSINVSLNLPPKRGSARRRRPDESVLPALPSPAKIVKVSRRLKATPSRIARITWPACEKQLSQPAFRALRGRGRECARPSNMEPKAGRRTREERWPLRR